MKRKIGIGTALLSASDGLVGATTDLLLLQIYGLITAGGVHTFWDANRAVEEAQSMLATVNYKTIKNALYQLTKRGLIKRSPKRTSLELAITKAGKERIDEILPTYRTTRPWDGHVYLISYDIPTKANPSRNLLREYIKATGGALLQESLWLNPYNPTLLLERYAEKHAIKGRILVSRLGTDGAIGEDTLESLLRRVYNLDHLTDDYEVFIDTYKNKQNASPFFATIDYHSILRHDPQLPFPLEPKDFPARHAYDIFRSITTPIHSKNN